jgi:hypothetical protein
MAKLVKHMRFESRKNINIGNNRSQRLDPPDVSSSNNSSNNSVTSDNTFETSKERLFELDDGISSSRGGISADVTTERVSSACSNGKDSMDL